MKAGKPDRNRLKSNSRFTRSSINEVIRLEEKVWKAAQDRDAEAFKKLVPSDAVMIFQSGVVTQPQYLAAINARTIERYELGRMRGFMPNATTVILYYRARRIGEESGAGFPAGEVVESTTWIKRDRRWVAILNQETPVSGAGS